MPAQLNTFYTTAYGDFEIREGRYLFNSYDREGKSLLCGATAEAVLAMTPTLLEAQALGLKEERSYDGTVGGKL